MAVESIGRRAEVEFVPVAGGDHGFVGVFAEAGKQIEDDEKAKAHALTVKYKSADGESVWCRGGVNFSIPDRRGALGSHRFDAVLLPHLPPGLLCPEGVPRPAGEINAESHGRYLAENRERAARAWLRYALLALSR
jgi:hypothetical protein